jgi:hypothetical protein
MVGNLRLLAMCLAAVLIRTITAFAVTMTPSTGALLAVFHQRRLLLFSHLLLDELL